MRITGSSPDPAAWLYSISRLNVRMSRRGFRRDITRGILDQLSSPPRRVEPRDIYAQSTHSRRLLRHGHSQRTAQRRHRFIHSIRIDQKRRIKLRGGAGKATEHEHTTLVVALCNRLHISPRSPEVATMALVILVTSVCLLAAPVVASAAWRRLRCVP